MNFKLSQITVLVVSALSVSAGVAATDIDIVDNKTSGGNGSYQTEFTGSSEVNTPVEYTGSIKDSSIDSLFVGKESSSESGPYFTYENDHDGNPTNIKNGVYYQYSHYYSPVSVKNMLIKDSNADINGQADNLDVRGSSVVTITGSNAYASYRGANAENQTDPNLGLPVVGRPGEVNNRQDEVTISTGNGTYSDESKQYLDGSRIGDVKKIGTDGATLTIKGTNVTDDRLGADKGEYLVATGDTFNGKAEQHVGERSLSQGATFKGQSSQHLKGKDGKKAVSLDAIFTGTAGVKHTGQTVGSNSLAIDSKFDYADQTINTGGVAKGNTIKDGDQLVKGTAEKTNITNGNQTIGAGGKATTNSIDNTNSTHGLQLVSGEATDNSLKNADQIIEKTGVAVKNVIDNAGAEHGIQVVRGKAEDNTLSNTDQRVEKDGIASVKNDITDGSQLVDGFAENNTITNKATNRGKQVINGTANNNKLTETDQFVGKNGTAGIKNDITNGSQYVDGFAENNTITNNADKRGVSRLSAAPPTITN